MDKVIIEKIQMNQELNHRYYVIAKSKYLLNGQVKGILTIDTEIEQFNEYLEGSRAIPKISIDYEIDDSLKYDPNTEYIVKISDTEPTIIKSTFNPSKYFSLVRYEDSLQDFIESTPCIECGNCARQKLVNTDIGTPHCENCMQNMEQKAIFECAKCCTIYFYF